MVTSKRDSSTYYSQARNAAERIAIRGDDFALQQLVTLRSDIDNVLIPDAVDTRRRKGATWAEIGEDLGLTRQGAQQRFGGAQIDQT